jgi:predicted SAM-dependent methyltransferase
VDIAYSNQLMEHLHPDDALEQLAGVFDALALGGRYVCVTPNRLTGPHDVSRYFDDTATCFHLREYTVTELSDLFAQVGFSKVRLYVGAKGLYSQVPATLLLAFERWLDGLPDERRRSVVRNAAVSLPLNGVRLVATK